MKKVLIADDMHLSITEMLIEAGFDPDYQPKITRDEMLKVIGEFHGLIIRSKTNVDREMLDAATKLEFVGRAGAGIDKIDYPYLTSKNIRLVNAPEGNRDAVGEQTIGVLLSLLHRINLANREVKNDIWDREGNRGFELKNRTVGVFGYGFMGSSLAGKLKGFQCRVIAYDKYKSGFSNEFVEQVDLDTFKAETEILSIHVPLTAETRQLFNADFFNAFPKLKIVLNTARGEVLNSAGLLELLESGKLWGAGLDVLENEKINKLSSEEQEVFDRLKKLDNVILTPHVAGWTHESYERINRVIVNKLQEAGLAVG
ncbi:NAD(P)-dependent oxidoreductase [Marinoscillum sp. MHG1-6]|uniref:NAD(P)-dependent oxidoreductase n=1 Tax=Marinoscillum sp. MHG1-6 TaxID=2959627 RepID=UPI002158A0F3|nr:NAD(P)-dependent oxidoreductase [Marinoscillum sp. MHG1-6]